MENWENKIIADKLNSLQDLPEDYAPDLSSKWELIQSGLTKKPAHWKWLIWPTSILIALFFVWHFLPREQEANEYTLVTSVKAQWSDKNEMKNFPQVKSTNNTVKMEGKQKPNKRLPASTKKGRVTVKDSNHFQPVLIQTAPVPIDSLYHSRKDTIKYHTPIAQLPARLKRKVFQKDFDGMIGREESNQSKTAQKIVQVKFFFQKSKESSASPTPAFRFTQNF